VVEDHRDSLDLLARLLRGSGFSVHEAGSCAQALHVLEHARCRVLVADIELPDCSGLDLLRTIWSRRFPIRAIALSAHTGHDTREAAHAAGFEHFVAKPFRFDELLTAVRALMN
jgi:CheY-like chemotaxis protein